LLLPFSKLPCKQWELVVDDHILSSTYSSF
jgi:hypothetical protein